MHSCGDRAAALHAVCCWWGPWHECTRTGYITDPALRGARRSSLSSYNASTVSNENREHLRHRNRCSRCRQLLESSSEEHVSTQFWSAVQFHTRRDEAIRRLDAAGISISSSSHPKSAKKYDMHQALSFYAYALANAAPTACIQIGLRPSSARSLPRMKLHCVEATRKGGIANYTLIGTTLPDFPHAPLPP
ncbi:hypothetical protein LZ30DRAFT_10711 [Colletotrichum cereale]|nr:hypothetical protein LZ30DRAFT_10711 [Colletotrichum cereale]